MGFQFENFIHLINCGYDWHEIGTVQNSPYIISMSWARIGQSKGRLQAPPEVVAPVGVR